MATTLGTDRPVPLIGAIIASTAALGIGYWIGRKMAEPSPSATTRTTAPAAQVQMLTAPPLMVQVASQFVPEKVAVAAPLESDQRIAAALLHLMPGGMLDCNGWDALDNATRFEYAREAMALARFAGTQYDPDRNSVAAIERARAAIDQYCAWMRSQSTVTQPQSVYREAVLTAAPTQYTIKKQVPVYSEMMLTSPVSRYTKTGY